MKPSKLVESLVVTAEVMGHEMSVAAAEVMARELAQHEPAAVATALRRCQRELTGRLSLAKVLERVPGQHIGAEEAWALCPRSESQSVVWTDEISQAFGVADELLKHGDAVAARMAFRETYERLVAQSRASNQRPKWWPSLGHDAAGRAAVIAQAVECGRLSADHGERVVGHLPSGSAPRLASGAAPLAEVLRRSK